MSDSSLTPRSDALDAEASQVLHPWVTTARTAVQTAIPALLVFVVVVPEIAQAIVDGMGESLPEGLRPWLLGAAAFTTAVAGTLARIFAIPGVNRALSGVGLSVPPRQP